MDEERISDYCNELTDNENFLSEDSGETLYQSIRNKLLSVCYAPTELGEKEINTYVTLFSQETQKRKGLEDKTFLPPYVHRLSQQQTEVHVAQHSEAANLIASEEARSAVERRRIIVSEKGMSYSIGEGFEYDVLLEFTRLYANGKGPAVFFDLPKKEKEAAFLSFIENQKELTHSVIEGMTPDNLLNFAKDRLAYIAFGRRMTSEKLEIMAKQFGVTLSDDVLREYEENCEPLLSSLSICHDRVYRMANPYYKEYDIDTVAAAASLLQYQPIDNNELPSDKYFKSQWKNTTEIFGGFLGLCKSSEDGMAPSPITKEDEYSQIGRVAACFDRWSAEKFGDKPISFYSLSNPEAPLKDTDACTEALEKGEVLICICEGEGTLFSADLSSGQMKNMDEASVPDFVNEKETAAYIKDLMCELSLLQTSSPTASREFKNFDRALRRLAETDVKSDEFSALAKEAADEAQKYVTLKKHTSKPFTDKTFRRLELAKRTANALSVGIGVNMLEKNGTLAEFHSSNVSADIAKNLRERHDARPIPGVFSFGYGRARYQMNEKLQQLELSVSESQEKQEEQEQSEVQPTEMSESERIENEELENRILNDLSNSNQTEKTEEADAEQLETQKTV